MQDDIFKITHVLFSCWGNFEKNVEGGDKYCGGNTRSKCLQQGVTFEKLKGLVGEWFNIDEMVCEMKYTMKFDEKVLVDLINDDELENLFRYNDNCAHVYVATKSRDNYAAELDDTLM